MRIDAFKRGRIISWRIQAVQDEAESNTQSEEGCAMPAIREADKPSQARKPPWRMYVCNWERLGTGVGREMKGSDG